LYAGIALAALAIVTAYAIRLPRPPAASGAVTPVERIAVLPFANNSGDPSQDSFSNGMTDELITRLAQTGTLTVISRTSVMAFQHTQESMREIGRQLQVQAIVEGAVLHAQGRVRISVNLVDVASDRQIWADSFEREYTDVLRLQSEIARTVTQQVKGRLSPEGEKRLASAGAINPEAYEQYLLGRHYVALRNAEASERGVAYLK
jgi:adenylate cyclase